MLKLAIVGAGSMAREHLRVLNKMPDIDVVGIYSRTNARAAALSEEFSIRVVARSINELYLETQAAGVVIAVSEVSTESICLQALAHPWKLLVEKPVGLCLDETRRILDFAEGKEDSFFVAMNRRNYASTLMALNELSRLGGERVIQIIDQEDPLLALRGGRLKQVCDQWHFANSIHLIDLINVFCRGSLVSVNNVIPWQDGYLPKVTHSIISFDSGDIGIYHSVWNAPGPWSLTIETTKKRIEMRPLENLAIQTYPERHSEFQKISREDDDLKPGFLRQMHEFSEALKGRSCNLPTLKTYLTTAKLTHELYSI